MSLQIKIMNIYLNTKIFYHHLLNIGPPKQAANPIFAYPFRANAMFEIKSPILLPQARTDNPSIELLNLLMTPKVLSTDTTSDAIDEIIMIDPVNEPKIANI